jgi:MacB-like periplasmic core domain
MARVPILCRWLLNAAAPVVPREMREEWRREWYGELWHFIDERLQSGDAQACKMAMSHCKGALADAIYLRRNDDASRAAVQKVVRHPGFSVGALAVLMALLAAFTSGFENTRRMIRPLPYRSPEQIAVVRQTSPFMGARLGFPLAKIPGWRKAETLDGIAAYAGYRALVEAQGVREVSAVMVEPEFFQVLGVQAQAGRLFQESDTKSCADCVVIGDELWRSAFHADRGAIGRTYKIAGRPLKIIGVLPAGFWFFTDSPEVWTLITSASFVDPKTTLVYAIARLRPGASEKTSLDELRRLYRNLPPYIKPNSVVRAARQVEEARITSLMQDPLYRLLPIVLAGIFVFAAVSAAALPVRKTSLRGAAFFVVKVSLCSLAVTLGAIEFAYAPGMRMTGVRGFGPEAISLWLLIFGFTISFRWAWDDQRKRCPTCLCRLSMPVQVGSRGHVLMEWMSTELVCPQGHGVLWAPEDPLESHPKDRWLKLDESWQDLFEVTNKD